MKIKSLLGIALIALALAACSGPGQTVQKFIVNVDAGNIDAATKQLSSGIKTSMGEGKARALLAAEQQKFQRSGGLERVDILDETIKGDTAVVKYTIVTKNKATKTTTDNLIKEDGSWKIGM